MPLLMRQKYTAPGKNSKKKMTGFRKLHSEMNQFVYSLSHELRGPLMSISGISKLAKMEVTDPVSLNILK
jgi:two-component system, sensor histidine kinase and response regulator